MMRAFVIMCLLVGAAHADDVPDKPRCADSAACKKACTKGDGESCWVAGASFEPSDEGKGDLRKAKPFYDRACKLGVVRGCLSLASAERATGKGKGARAASAAVKRAITLQAKACAKKDPAACDDVASMYATRLDKPDEKSAKLYREKACRLRTNAPCTPACADEEGAKEALDAASAANNRRYTDELARQDLKAVVLTQRLWPSSAGGVKVHAGSWTDGAVAEVEWQGKSVRVVVAADIEGGCPAVQRRLEYVQREKTIYRVERVPKITSSKSFKACSCGPRCGGPGAATMHVGYEMPAGTVYGGTVKVAYDLDEVKMVPPACPP